MPFIRAIGVSTSEYDGQYYFTNIECEITISSQQSLRFDPCRYDLTSINAWTLRQDETIAVRAVTAAAATVANHHRGAT